MAQVTTIPRFLLPQTGGLWRQAGTSVAARPSGLPVRIRFASSSGPARDKDGKPIVLEKPERFNPPSHGSRLPKRTTPRHYGGDLSASEAQAQRVKDYPGLMAPKGTLSHWIWTSYWLHSAIAMVCTHRASWSLLDRNVPMLIIVNRAPSADSLSSPFPSRSRKTRLLPTCYPRALISTLTPSTRSARSSTSCG